MILYIYIICVCVLWQVYLACKGYQTLKDLSSIRLGIGVNQALTAEVFGMYTKRICSKTKENIE